MRIMNEDLFKFCNKKMVGEDKPTIIFLHGFTTNRNFAFMKLRKELEKEKEFNLINCDAKGHGKNSGFIYDWNTAFEDEEKIINSIKGDVIVIGHSMGGTKAISHGLVNSKVKKVISVSGLYDDDDLRFSLDKPKIPNIRRILIFDLNTIQKALPKNEISNACSDKHDNIYLVHGSEDNTVNIEQFYKNKSNLNIPDKNVLIVKGSHNVDEDKIVIDFIKEQIKKKE